MPAASQRTKPLGLFRGEAAPRLYDHLIGVLRVRHYSPRTEEAYVHWIRRYIEFHQRRHPRQLAESHVNRFLTHLAVFVFPQECRWRNRQTGEQGRHHMDESLIQKAVSSAVRVAGLTKRVTCHTFWHSFATHVLLSGYDIRTVRELLGHKDVRTTMICTHVLNRSGRGVRSPADVLRQERTQPGARRKQPNAPQDGR